MTPETRQRIEATSLLWRAQRLGLPYPLHQKAVRPYLPKGTATGLGGGGLRSSCLGSKNYGCDHTSGGPCENTSQIHLGTRFLTQSSPKTARSLGKGSI